MKSVIENLLAKHPEIKLINIFSDGARSQFKQKFTLSNLSLCESVLNIKFTWHFFATSHGKGVVVGLRGSIKRSVWHIICSQDCIISNASEYADLARQRNLNIDILCITKSKVNLSESKPFLEEQLANVRSYSGCSQMHCFMHYGNNISICQRLRTVQH